MREQKKIQIVKNLTGNTPREIQQMKLELETKDAAIRAFVQKINDPTNNNEVWPLWINLQNWANYFAGRWAFEVKDNLEWTIILNRVVRESFLFGNCGVWNWNGEPRAVIVGAGDPKDFTKAKISLLATHDLNKMTNANIQRVPEWFKETVPKTELINYVWDSNGYGSLIWLKPILTFETLIQKALINEATVLPTRLIKTTDNINTNNEATINLISLNTPILTRINGGLETFEGLTIPTNTDQLLNLIEAAKNWYYDILGRRTNSDFKLSHTLEAEANNSEANVQAIEWDRFLLLRAFLQKFSTMFKVEILMENWNGHIESVFAPILNEPPKEVINEVEPIN